MRILNNSTEIAAAAGEELGVSEWLAITQERIDLFADATGDRQWIHVDPAEVLASGRAMDVWKRMISAQGGDPDAALP
ncbi:MAG: hypothetical protein QOJ72_1172, partial [Nocardioidaceae bacterium]|nr:hypothetical protein [Nocardioidaceae bacterium]